MDVRLVQLLASFIRTTSDYTLARLEYTMHRPNAAPPPLLTRLPDASEEALRAQWPQIERDLEAIETFIARTRRDHRSGARSEAAFLWLKQLARELDRYARAMRWVLTVTERDDEH